VRIPGALDRKKAELQRLAEKTAVEAAAVAGVPGPAPEQEPAALLRDIRSALAVIAEALANRDREVARLRVRPAEAPAPRAPTRAALTLAELRDRARVLAEPSGEGEDTSGEGRLGWVIERLDEALHQLGVAEYLDDGRVDLARHQVIDRRPADPRHPSGTIASSVRSGLLLSGEVLRPQQVVVYANQPADQKGVPRG
jgi:hypothetical protein